MKSNVALLPRSLSRLAAAVLLTVVLALSALAPAMAMAAERAQPTAIVATANTLDVLAEAALSSQTDDGDIAVCAICKSPVCTGHSAVLTASSQAELFLADIKGGVYTTNKLRKLRLS